MERTTVLTAAITAVATTLVLALAFAVFSGIGAKAQETAYAPAAQQSARYQIFFSPHTAQDTFLVDTRTGAVWLEVVDKDGSVAGFEGRPVYASKGAPSQ